MSKLTTLVELESYGGIFRAGLEWFTRKPGKRSEAASDPTVPGLNDANGNGERLAAEMLEDFLESESQEKMGELLDRWLFLFDTWANVPQSPREDIVNAMLDTRGLVRKVMDLKAYADGAVDDDGVLQALGLGAGKRGDTQLVRFLGSSVALTEYLREASGARDSDEHWRKKKRRERKTPRKNRWQYLDLDGKPVSEGSHYFYTPSGAVKHFHPIPLGDHVQTEALDPDRRYPILTFICDAGSDDPKAARRELALSLMDGIMSACLANLHFVVRDGLLTAGSPDAFTNLWVFVAHSFRKRAVGRCRVCGGPMFVMRNPGRRAHKLYCSKSCKRMHTRAMKYKRNLDRGMSKEEATDGEISIGTAEEILARDAALGYS